MGAMAHVTDIVSQIEKIVTDWDQLEVVKHSDGNTSRTLPIKNHRSSMKEEAIRMEQRTFLQYFSSLEYWQLSFFLFALSAALKKIIDR